MMKNIKMYTILLLVFVAYPLFAQIVIDWTEIPHVIGTTWTKNNKDSVVVDLGSTGGPQTWVFTSQPMGTDSSIQLIVPVSSTPFADSFPDANLVYRSPADSDTVYEYYKLTAGWDITLGLGGTGPDTTFLMQYAPVDSGPLPLHYQDSRSFHYGFTIKVGGDSLRYDHFGLLTCNAYGTVTIPYGSYPCLRVCVFDTCAMIMYVNGMPVYWDTVTHIDYQFVAENYSGVVCIISYPEETNSNYTNAAILERLTSFFTGVEESKIESVFSISHQPNPFSDHVTITYALPKASHVDLRVYDRIGRLIKTVVNAFQDQGKQTAVWYGKDESGDRLPDGVYFYRLNVDGTDLTGKMLMLR
jgi:hypothetical protein